MSNKIVPMMVMVIVALAGCARTAVDTQQVSAVKITGPLPVEDPNAKLWNDAPEHPAKLMVQDVAEPKMMEPGISLIKVRALHNNDWLAFRLEWDDATQNLIPQPGASSDAVAIQFPLQAGADVPDAAMGEKGKGVRIWYWKAVWQDDDERAQAGRGDRIATLYPNATSDHYPFEANAAARDEMEKRYAPAKAAGNPILARPNASPVQVLMAEGFGHTTPSANQPSAGRGLWTRGRWTTTIARPIRGGAELGDLEVGKRTYIAFAVWDGAKQHTGSRKMRSGWIPFVLKDQ
ncbi:MAG: ethylbenzene dehydrogenase-related protein [Acidobacteriota bacterium]|nr:ethylbenzene dehydrogenase-related protein [Blastocatellia bacterium]MDW8240921.1 ethylbenzene dehydrogenase-related protein [Acidobacteriota bacterium]